MQWDRSEGIYLAADASLCYTIVIQSNKIQYRGGRVSHCSGIEAENINCVTRRVSVVAQKIYLNMVIAKIQLLYNRIQYNIV